MIIRREFKIKKHKSNVTDGDNERQSLILNHGTLVILKDSFNAKYVHRVMKDP